MRAANSGTPGATPLGNCKVLPELRNGELADGDDDPIRGLRAGERVRRCFDLLAFASEIDRLAKEVADIFDTNKYAHDPRADFLNWALVDTGSFDYAADAWGFTSR